MALLERRGHRVGTIREKVGSEEHCIREGGTEEALL